MASALKAALSLLDGNDLMRPIHDRMPVILTPESFDKWLLTNNG
ncbi:SOS response-associated peptidase family protein [Nitrosomonas ureae]